MPSQYKEVREARLLWQHCLNRYYGYLREAQVLDIPRLVKSAIGVDRIGLPTRTRKWVQAFTMLSLLPEVDETERTVMGEITANPRVEEFRTRLYRPKDMVILEESKHYSFDRPSFADIGRTLGTTPRSAEAIEHKLVKKLHKHLEALSKYYPS